MYYNRGIEQLTIDYLQQFRVLGIMGPRQSGKSTMIKYLLKNEYKYVTFDRVDIKNSFYDDPVKFLKLYNRKVIFDEVQQMPEIFPMIKIIADENPDDKGRFVLTGSGQFLLSKNISESLAGRIGLITLLPMQYSEMPETSREKILVNGGYPELVCNKNMNTLAFFNSYLQTYLQKDLRMFIDITNLSAFTQLIRLLAAQVGQHLNLSDISKEIGITIATLSRWVSILEASFIIYLLKPYHNNMGKRLVKTPKVYFYDNGLLCFLTGINTKEQLESGILTGAVFENFVITEMLKSIINKGVFGDLYFLRTSHGEEIDLIVDCNSSKIFIEIKSSHTYKVHFHKTLDKLADSNTKKIVVYQGDTHQVTPDVKAWNYQELFMSNNFL